jgi:hypothetical protein
MASLPHPLELPERPAGGLTARLHARLLPGALDRELARGADPRRSPALSARATRLVSPRMRAVVATGFERITEAATEPPTTFSASAPLRREAIRDATPELRLLAALVREADGVAPCGMARAWILLTEGSGPLHADTGHDCIRRAVRAAAEAL